MGFETSLFAQQPVDPTLICTICHEVLEKPMTVCDNGHIYCQKCINTWVSEKPMAKCPDCRLPIHAKRAICRPLESVISSMTVRCPKKQQVIANEEAAAATPETVASASGAASSAGGMETEASSSAAAPTDNKEDMRTIPQLFKRARLAAAVTPPPKPPTVACQCEWEGTLTDYLETHSTTECQVGTKACDLCLEQVIVASMKDHKEKDCRHRLVECSSCHVRVLALLQENHKSLYCSNAMVSCGGCQEKFLRSVLGKVEHDPSASNLRSYTGHREVCQELTVPCDYARHGCNHFVKRKDMKAHLEANNVEHIKLLNAALLKMETKMEEGKEWNDISFGWSIPRNRLRQICSEEGLLMSLYCTNGFHLRVGLSAAGLSTPVKIKIYVECHDDDVLIDKVKISFGSDGRFAFGGLPTSAARMEEDVCPFEEDMPVVSFTAYLLNPQLAGGPGNQCTLAMLEASYGDVARVVQLKFRLKEESHPILGCRNPSSGTT